MTNRTWVGILLIIIILGVIYALARNTVQTSPYSGTNPNAVSSPTSIETQGVGNTSPSTFITETLTPTPTVIRRVTVVETLVPTISLNPTTGQ